jgi:uncharacterized protein YecT (DUF1311 family)
MKNICLLVSLLISSSAFAQYNGPAVEACRAYAERELGKDSKRGVVLDKDATLSLDRYTQKVGSQFVSSVLTGNGAVVLDGTPSAELAFVCLLADEKRPVFFHWLGRPAVAMVQCSRSAALRAKPRPCLDHLLQVAESDLAQVYAEQFQQARARDVEAKSDTLTAVYRKANAEWLQYRDAECMRRRDLAPAGISADDFQLACTVDLSRRRLLDMR